jgi:hypothetical protein
MAKDNGKPRCNTALQLFSMAKDNGKTITLQQLQQKFFTLDEKTARDLTSFRLVSGHSARSFSQSQSSDRGEGRGREKGKKGRFGTGGEEILAKQMVVAMDLTILLSILQQSFATNVVNQVTSHLNVQHLLIHLTKKVLQTSRQLLKPIQSMQLYVWLVTLISVIQSTHGINLSKRH